MHSNAHSEWSFAQLKAAIGDGNEAQAAQCCRILAETQPNVSDLLDFCQELKALEGFQRASVRIASDMRLGVLEHFLRLCIAGDGLALDYRQSDISSLSLDGDQNESLVILTDSTDKSIMRDMQALAPLAIGLVLAEDTNAGTNAGPDSVPSRQGFHLVGQEVFDARLSSLGTPHISVAAAFAIAFEIAKRIRAVRGFSRKAILCDLDGVMWPGTLGEDGPGGIFLSGEKTGAHIALQQTIADLTQRDGVQLAIISKNLPADVIEAFDTHSSMPLGFSSFQGKRVGWSPKPETAEKCLDEMNAAPGHALFLDDNPAERLAMRAAFPEMVIPECAADPVTLEAYLRRLEWTWSDVQSEEDRLRFASTASHSQLVQHIEQSGHLAGLEMRAEVLIDDEISLDRAEQMFRRVTQFNTMGRILTREEISRAMASDESRLIALRLADKFADHGTTALALVRHDLATNRYIVEHFLMSCRILGRGVETVLLRCIAEIAKEKGATRIEGQTAVTLRNEPGREVFGRHGFAKIDQTDNVTHWRLAPGHEATWPETHIDIKWGKKNGG